MWVVRNDHLHLSKLIIMNLSLKDVNDLYYVVGRMMEMDKEDRVFISYEELEVLSDKLRELIEVKYEEENY
jgi:hypothetical protein